MSAPQPLSRARFGTLTDLALALAVFVLAGLAFLQRPIELFETHTYCSADAIAQGWTATRDRERTEKPHAILLDPVVQFQPWVDFASSELEAGRWPLWNPYNAAGEPLLANYQSAVFSPFTVPFYLWGYKAGLIVAALLKLALAGLFTFLFLRELGAGRWAALFGAAGYAFSGFQVVWIQYPHTSVTALLPAALFCAERVLGACERREQRLPWIAAMGLVAALALSVLAGHPEALLFCAVVVSAYCAGRVLQLAWARRSDAVARAGVVRALGVLAVVALLATAAGACQLLPFLEYLRHSDSLGVERHAARWCFRSEHWPLLMFPNVLGVPQDGSLLKYFTPWPNYQEFGTLHVALVAPLLAVVGLPLWWGVRAARAFGVLVLLWWAYAWNVGGVSDWLVAHTPLDRVLAVRSTPMWNLPICVLGALGAERLAQVAGRRRWIAAAVIALAGAVAWYVFHGGAVELFRAVAPAGEAGPAEMSEAVAAHMVDASLAFVGAAGAAALLAFVRWRWAVHAAWLVLLLATLWDASLCFRDYVPTVPDGVVYPQTPALADLQRATSGETVLVLSNDRITPEANVAYRMPMVVGYDAMGVADTTRMATELFGDPRRTCFARRVGLDLFGVRYVVSRSLWVPVDTALGDQLARPERASPYLLPEVRVKEDTGTLRPLKRDAELRLRFLAQRPGLDGLSLWFQDDKDVLRQRIAVEVRDTADGRALAQRTVFLYELQLLTEGRRELVLQWEPLARSGGAPLELVVRGGEGGPKRGGAHVMRRLKDVPQRGYAPDGPDALTVAGEPTDANVALDLAYGSAAFRHVLRFGDQELFEYAAGRGRAWMVGRARTVRSHEDAWRQVLAPGFDPRQEVVLESAEGVGSEDGAAGEVSELARTATSASYRARAPEAGWLVLAQAWFPGWRARLDGRPARVERANYAMTAVAVPAGEHVVELEYAPGSFRAGLWISLAAVVLTLALGWRLRRPRVPAPAPGGS